MKLIVGLGNPGQRYERTRHNVGFAVIKRLVESNSLPEPRKQFEGIYTEWILGGTKSLLVMPQTFMNLSGQCVRRFVDFYKIEVQDVLIIADDLDLKVGQLRLRSSGSSGGQKGLQSVIQHLGSDQVARLRIGIGRPTSPQQAADYVLQEMTLDEQCEFKILVDEAIDGVDVWIRDGIVAAMNRVNRPRN